MALFNELNKVGLSFETHLPDISGELRDLNDATLPSLFRELMRGQRDQEVSSKLDTVIGLLQNIAGKDFAPDVTIEMDSREVGSAVFRSGGRRAGLT